MSIFFPNHIFFTKKKKKEKKHFKVYLLVTIELLIVFKNFFSLKYNLLNMKKKSNKLGKKISLCFLEKPVSG
jgi:hypothetical protein